MFRWVIENKLARGPRPRYGKEWVHHQVPRSTVHRWIETAKVDYGIRSIICLLDQKSLRLYEQLPFDLISYYRMAGGLEVEHIPVRLQRRLFSAAQLKAVWAAYNRLPKPILIHCSAGIRRCGVGSRYIKQRLTRVR
jgi:protein tyrosine phosphatase (PTP) superfamily phosphohydrolase (DUF442 family)